MYELIKYNNGQKHHLEFYESKTDAISHAKTLHHPDWPCWQGIEVWSPDGKEVFDTNESNQCPSGL